MKVLIVDDNKTITDLLTDFMGFFGLEADAARDGLEAIDKLRKEKFDSVITDGYMPHMSGFDLCRFIKTHFPFIYTIGITDSLSLDKFRAAGADDCFNKPVDPTLLYSLIKMNAAAA